MDNGVIGHFFCEEPRAVSTQVISGLSFLSGNLHVGNVQKCATSKDKRCALASTSEIRPNVEGEKIVIASKIIPNDETVVYTLTFCEDSNLCFDKCNARLITDNGINLLPRDAEIRHIGTNFD